MALLRWDDEEEKKQEDELSPRPSTSIASVQSTWQPVSDTEGTQGGNQQPNNDNYLMSEEKAMADQRLQQRREAEAAAQAEAQRQAAIARENSARAQAAEEAAQQAQQEQSYKPKDAGEAIGDFFQGLGEGLWKGGAGLVGSGASLVSSIVSGDAENDVTKATRDWQKSADDWGNSVHADGAGEFLGTLPGGVVSGILDPANYMIRGVRNTPEMLAALIAAGSSDANLSKVGTEMQKEIQARQFGEDVAKNGDGAMLMEGIAKPGEMILNVVTAGGASVPLRVSEQAYKEIAKTAAKEGIINVAGGVPLSVLEQAARGQEITPESVAKESLLQGAVGATIGGISKGYTISKNRSGTSKDASILERELTPLERAAEDDNISFQQKNGTPVADGVVTPVTTGAPQYTPIADGTARSKPLAEAPDQLNGQTPPDWDEVTAREVAAVREQPAPAPEQAPAVADGTAQAPVAPLENMPTIKSEEVRALQEARVGKSQAEEAVINERLKELNDDTPSVYRSEAPDRYGIGQAQLGNGLYTGSKETAGRRADGTISEDGLYEYKVNPEAKVLDASSDEFRSLNSQASTHPSLKEPGISETEWRNRKTAILGQFVREAGYDGVKHGTNEFVGMSERALIPVTEGAPVYRGEAPTRQVDDTKYSLNNNYDDAPATIKELNRRSRQLHGDRNVSLNSNLTDGKGNDAYGMYTYADDMIKIAEGRGINTMNHESVHRAFRQHLTPEERASVLDEIKKAYAEPELRSEYEGQGYYKRTTNELAEEQLANNFIKYAEERANGKDITIAGKTINIPRKAVVLFERVYLKIKETFGNPDYVQQFYARLESGKYRGKGQLLPAGKALPEPAYMVAGKNAKTFDPADKKGRNFTGIDKLTRFEIDDSTAKLSDAFIDRVKAVQKSGRGGSTVRLGDVLDHSKLFDAYPDIADIKVSIFHAAPAGGKIRYGGYIPSADSMRLNAHPRTARELRATILHEVQHAVQEREGFIGGLTKQQRRELGRGQPAGEKYYRSADEIESRLVETRRDMSQSERDATPFYDTIPADKPIGKTVIGNRDYETMPQVHTGTRIAEEMKAAGKKPTPNKNIVPEPFAGNLPDNLTPDAPTRATMPAPRKPRKPAPVVTPEQKSINDFAKRVFSNTDLHKDFRRRLARVLGLEKDTESPVSELLQQTSVKVSGRDKSIIQKRFNELEAITNEFNKLMRQQRKGYQNNKVAGLDEATSKRANQLIDTYGRIERDLNGYVRKIQGKKSFGNRVANIAENLTGARNASILTSVGGVSRNISQELGANILETVLHPVRMTRGVVHMPAEIARAYKRTAKEFTVKPKTVSEVFPYAIGNTYRFIMSPVTGIANVRKGVARDTLAESLLRAQGETPTRAEIKRFAGAMGADSEVVANNLMGIMNGMTSHGKGLEVMRSYQEFIKTGSVEAKAAFLKNTETASNLAAKMTQMATESNDPKVRLKVALMNTVFPFVNTASNLAKTAATYNLSPVSRSINDEVLKAVRSNPANVLAILKNKAVTYGVLGGVYALYEADVIGYNDGEEIDKPRGIYIDMGNGNFHAVRATPIELPIAAVVTAAEIAKHAAEGDVRPVGYYAGIMGNSLPYVDSTTNLTSGATSMVNSYLGGDGAGGTDDNGYAAKAFGVNMAKSYVPWANNGVIPAINSQNGKSTNAKSVYNKDMGVWLNNSVRSNFDPAFRESLKDSRDNAGRVRTVDQQGLWSGINKTINDKDTATYNETINNLVTFGRQNGLGRGTKDMFNTYDTGKNNNFKSVQDAITFLDAEAGADGKKSPKAEDKLKNNEKLADLAVQIRDGFWGDTGDTLLMLGDQQLYSDVSVPNKNGTKNSRLPLNMQSIKNAIAAADLPEEQRNRIYEISQANQALYARRQAGEITYDEEQAMKAQSEQEYVDILSNSENYKKMSALMVALDEQGFFNVGGLGSTKAGQTYLWNSLNALLGSKGATPAAQWDSGAKSGWGGGGGGGGSRAIYKPTNRGVEGMKWAPVGKRKMADVKTGKYTPLQIKVKLGNAVKKNETQDYSDRSF